MKKPILDVKGIYYSEMNDENCQCFSSKPGDMMYIMCDFLWV
jgi:hypothetical protein